jgi:hypothetical protein
MPKYRYLALAAAGVMVLAPGSVAFAASAHQAAKHDVLTIKKVDGTAVRKGAKLTAGLAKGAKLSVSFGALGGASCTTSAITAKVKTNSTTKATLSLTGQTASKCTLTGEASGLGTLKSVTAVNLPANVTVKAAKGGGTVTVAESSKSKPFGLAASVDVTGVGTLTCAFTAKTITAKAVNKSNSIEVSSVTLSLNSKKSNSSECSAVGKTVKVSVTYGPLRDSSAKGAKVFVS